MPNQYMRYLKGPQGKIGPQGFQGLQGLSGEQGIGNTGLQNAVGPTSDDGFQGLSGLGLQGVQGSQGDLGIASDIVGPQGSQGGQGYGVQGNQGVQGLQGDSTASSVVGPQGSQGAQGSQGVQGFINTSGVQGLQGPQGPQGAQGIQGTQQVGGYIGAQGSQQAGASGGQGRQGINLGGDGSQGRQGKQGIQSSGTQGGLGRQGVQGNLVPETYHEYFEDWTGSSNSAIPTYINQSGASLLVEFETTVPNGVMTLIMGSVGICLMTLSPNATAPGVYFGSPLLQCRGKCTMTSNGRALFGFMGPNSASLDFLTAPYLIFKADPTISTTNWVVVANDSFGNTAQVDSGFSFSTYRTLSIQFNALKYAADFFIDQTYITTVNVSSNFPVFAACHALISVQSITTDDQKISLDYFYYRNDR
jgi:hypothetical protein